MEIKPLHRWGRNSCPLLPTPSRRQKRSPAGRATARVRPYRMAFCRGVPSRSPCLLFMGRKMLWLEQLQNFLFLLTLGLIALGSLVHLPHNTFENNVAPL